MGLGKRVGIDGLGCGIEDMGDVLGVLTVGRRDGPFWSTIVKMSSSLDDGKMLSPGRLQYRPVNVKSSSYALRLLCAGCAGRTWDGVGDGGLRAIRIDQELTD